jgi:hypothetical protein
MIPDFGRRPVSFDVTAAARFQACKVGVSLHRGCTGLCSPPMSRRRRIIAVGLTVFVVFGILYAFVSTSWHSQLMTPSGVPAENVVYKCGPLWGSGYVRGPSTTKYPVEGKPCSTRTEDRDMDAADIILGIAGIALAVTWGRQRSVPRLAEAA